MKKIILWRNLQTLKPQRRIQVWADPAPAPSFDSQIMQIKPFFGLYQPFGPLFLQI